MNTKKLTYSVIFCSMALLNTIVAQLKVIPSGNVGIGTNNPMSKLHVHGQVYTSGPSGHYLRLVHNPGPEIGSSTDEIEFWYSGVNYNKLKAQQYIKMSDSTIKIDINPIRNGLNTILKLNSFSYYLKDDSTKTMDFGLIAQEVQEVLPSIVSQTSKGILGIDYDALIPFLIEAIKEQQQIIDSLKLEIKEIQSNLIYNSRIYESSNNANVLHQNAPNPFSDKTVIRFDISENDFFSASIVIFDMNGTLLKTHPIRTAGSGQIVINGRELKAGMFIYSLLVNNKEVDTKKMILLN